MEDRKKYTTEASAGVSELRDQVALTDDYLGSLIELAEAEPYSQFAPALRGLWRQRDELAEALREVIESCRASDKRDGWIGSLRCPNPVEDGPKFARAETLLAKLK